MACRSCSRPQLGGLRIIRTRTHPDRWEHGSDFHLSLEGGLGDYPWKIRPAAYWGSGRSGLRGLLAWGRAAFGWRRLLCPSYFCQDVVEAVRLEIDVAVYESAPTLSSMPVVVAGPGDVVLLAHTFGLHDVPAVPDGTMYIEDHSHDPVARSAIDSTAHYAVASLRKTLPLPDGGVVWSPRGLKVPPERGPTTEHSRAVLDRLSAMTLKRDYLAGHAIDKEDYLRLAAAGEQAIGAGPISGISDYSRARLATMPVGRWHRRRGNNLTVFRHALGTVPGVTLLEAPFAATLIFDQPRDRDRVRTALIGARIYPAILWALDGPLVSGIPEEHVRLSRRMLTLHCDQRYDATDMARVAQAIRHSLEAP